LLWGFYHFTDDLIVIEDELTLLNFTSDDLAEKVRQKELDLWGPNPTSRLLRVADSNNPILLNDLYRNHKITFRVTSKDNKDAQINRLRVLIRDGKLAIHPRCKLLIKTLRLAKRAKQARRGFEHLDEHDHADTVDALLYLVRNVRRNRMPDEAPPTGPQAALPQAPRTPLPSGARELRKVFRLGRR